MTDRVLSLSMRPKVIKDIVGQDKLVACLVNQFKSGRVPHFWIFHGVVGSGKTTLARMVALALQKNKSIDKLTLKDWDGATKLDTREYNAANTNGVDDIRQVISGMSFKPNFPSKCKIVIFDEAHQITVPAQNCLITSTEDVSDHIFFIFCTSNLTKIIPALRRRAFLVEPEALNASSTQILLSKAAKESGFSGETAPLSGAIQPDMSPGLLLQAAERFFCGYSPEESSSTSTETKLDMYKMYSFVKVGNWSETSKLLRATTKTDVYAVRGYLLACLRNEILSSPHSKAHFVSKSIKVLAGMDSDPTCLVTLIANICQVCTLLKPPKK